MYACTKLQDDAARLARLKSASASLAVEDDVHRVNPGPAHLPPCLLVSIATSDNTICLFAG